MRRYDIAEKASLCNPRTSQLSSFYNRTYVVRKPWPAAEFHERRHKIISIYKRPNVYKLWQASHLLSSTPLLLRKINVHSPWINKNSNENDENGPQLQRNSNNIWPPYKRLDTLIFIRSLHEMHKINALWRSCVCLPSSWFIFENSERNSIELCVEDIR